MMKWLIYSVIFLSINVLSAQSKYAENAQKLYQSKEYNRAIKNWQMEFRQENANQGMCLYNIANNLMMLKDYPQAVLFYERALKLDYNHPETQFNLKVARAKLGLSTEDNTFVFKQWMNKFLYSVSAPTLKYIIVVLAFLVLSLVVLKTFFFTNIKLVYLKTIVGLLCFLGLWVFMVSRNIHSQKYGIVMSENCNGYENTTHNGTSRPIQLGKKVQILDEFEEKYQVITEKDTTLWIEKSDLKII